MSQNFLLCVVAACGAALAPATARADRVPDPDTPIWAGLKRSLFEGRPVSASARGIIELAAPERAEDAAVVPVAIRAQFAQTRERHIRRLYLIVDNNPSPVAAVVELTPESGRASLETRIRVEQNTYVRAVAELADGRLVADARFVKAAGGCSAPAGEDRAAAAARLGRVRLSVADDAGDGQPLLAQLVISHPSDSGLVMDQLTRLTTPAHFVRSVEVSYGGKTVLSAELGFTISENPNLRFYFLPGGGGELRARAVDTQGATFENSLRVARGARPG